MTSKSLSNDPKNHFEEVPPKDRSKYRKKMLDI